MYGSLLSILLLGMLPVAAVPPQDSVALRNLAIASPSPITASASTLLELSRDLSSSGAIIEDLQSGQVLFRKRGDERRPMGSLTKLMTALLIVERHGDALDTEVTVPEGIADTEGSSAHLKPGEKYTVGDLLTATLVASANDAAETLALFDAGSEENFVAAMNLRAAALGLKDTSFANPAGLDAPGQYSTPQDLAWLAAFVLRQQELRGRISLPSATIHAVGGRTLVLENTHVLLHQPGPVVAGKTGTTEAAGQCLLSIVSEQGREYVVVLLGSQARYKDMRTVLSLLKHLLG